jgi:hypothetical protein
MQDAGYQNDKRGSPGVDQFIHFVAYLDPASLRAMEIRIRRGRLEVVVRGAAGGIDRVHDL